MRITGGADRRLDLGVHAAGRGPVGPNHLVAASKAATPAASNSISSVSGGYEQGVFPKDRASSRTRRVLQGGPSSASGRATSHL
jgi:hypothetical protein